LDVGCGFGDFLMIAKSKNKVVIGVDLDKTALNYCRANGFDVIRCDAFHLPFRDHSIDGIFFSHVIEHIPCTDALVALTEFRRVLKNKLIVVTPTEHQGFWSEKGHITAYTKNKLKHTLCQAGYRVLKVFYDKCFMFGINDSEFYVKIFNLLPNIWLKMNIVAIATVKS